MKKFLTCILLLCMLGTKAQQNVISSIIISMPSTVPADINDWATALPPVSITAQAKLDSSRGLSPDVQESRILVTIKSNGSIICGEYTQKTAPMAGFNSPVRNWRGSDIEKLIGPKGCVLRPGQYTFCVQFFNYEGKQLSEERCKTFTINGDVATGDEKYTPPQAIMPADGKVFTEKEAKAPITFRWTPVVPKPAGKVIYTIKVYEVQKDQTANQAVKTNSPVAEKEITDQTQFISCCGNVIVVWPKNVDTKLAWQVEAKGEQGKNYGKSEVNTFSVANGGCHAVYDAKIDSIKCIDYNHVKVCASINCIQSGYGPNPGYTVFPTQITIAKLIALPSNTIVATNSTLGNVNEGSSLSVCFASTAIPTGTTQLNVKFETKTVDPNHNCINEANADTTMPNCSCNPCKNKRTRLITDSTKYSNNSINSYYTVTQIPAKIIKVSAQIVNFERLGEYGCMKCTRDSKEFGNFTGGSLNSNGGSLVNAPNGYGKQIQWNFSAPTSVANFKADLQMAVPPLQEVSCCKDSIKYCIRWSFVDENCVTCDTLICSVVVRAYQKPGPIWHTGIYAAQMSKMGEPFNSWYLQESKELPKNFDEQIEIFFQKNMLSKEPEMKKEMFVENMKNSFYQIQALKSSAATDAVWSAISGNATNTQCGAGDFETGLLNTAEWSGGWNDSPPSTFSVNNPSLFSPFSIGFSPAVVGLNLSMTTPNHHSIVSYGNDPVVGALLKTTSSPSNLFSIRLGNSSVNYGTEILSKKLIVNGTGVIKFMYASVFNDGGHGTGGNPSFWVKVYSSTGTPITNVVYLEPSSTSPLDNIVGVSNPTFFQDALGGAIKYRDWTCAKIDLSQYIGQTVSIAFVTTDCHGGAHYGYTYIDNWCGNCEGASSGSVTIKQIKDSCIKSTTNICVDYTLPKGSTTGTGTIKLQFYQNGNPIIYSITSPTLTANGTYCFSIDPSKLPCTNGQQGYDVVATGTFALSTATVVVTSPDPVGAVGNVQGIKPGKNNDLVCCGTLADKCCDNFKKGIITTVTVLGTAANGYTAIKFAPTFNVGPKPIKQVRISVLNFETNSSNKECLTCESNTNSYGAMSVPGIGTGFGKDAIEGMVYATNPMILTCLGCPPLWNAGKPTHEVTWGSMSGAGYNLSDGVGDQTTQFTVTVPKKSSLSCCDDTLKICIKYSFTDVDCTTCDTVICYQVINRGKIFTFGLSAFNDFDFRKNKLPWNRELNELLSFAIDDKRLTNTNAFHLIK